MSGNKKKRKKQNKKKGYKRRPYGLAKVTRDILSFSSDRISSSIKKSTEGIPLLSTTDIHALLDIPNRRQINLIMTIAYGIGLLEQVRLSDPNVFAYRWVNSMLLVENSMWKSALFYSRIGFHVPSKHSSRYAAACVIDYIRTISAFNMHMLVELFEGTETTAVRAYDIINVLQGASIVVKQSLKDPVYKTFAYTVNTDRLQRLRPSPIAIYNEHQTPSPLRRSKRKHVPPRSQPSPPPAPKIPKKRKRTIALEAMSSFVYNEAFTEQLFNNVFVYACVCE